MRTANKQTTSKPKGKKLKLNKQTVKDLDTPKAEQVKGGGIPVQRTMCVTGQLCCADISGEPK